MLGAYSFLNCSGIQLSYVPSTEAGKCSKPGYETIMKLYCSISQEKISEKLTSRGIL